MKKRKISVQWRSVLTLLAFVITFSGFAQTKTVSGVVVDKQNEPLIGVAVKVQGTSIAVATNIDGKFVLTKCARNSSARCEFRRYETTESVGCRNINFNNCDGR